MKSFSKALKRYVPIPVMVILLLTLIAAGIHVAYSANATFADLFNMRVSQPLRGGMAHLTGWLPFSLAETIVIGSPVILVAVLSLCIQKGAKNNVSFVRTILGILSVALLVYVLFVFLFGAGYRTTPLEDKLELDATEISAQELYDTTVTVIDRLNGLADQILYAPEKGSLRPYSHEETVDLCVDAYAALAEQYDFIPLLDAPVKQIVLSEPMTYTHISGVYTFFTGEANLNTNYPHYVNAYTTAHEMAHQRGIARENEANFIAYLVCITSDDPFMQYAGYLNMYEYLASPLYTASPTLYGKAVSTLDNRVLYDLRCYSKFFDRYRTNVAATVSSAVNDTYLTIQGTEGTRSYGMVVDLAVAYHKTHP